jgi:hypothetical protein
VVCGGCRGKVCGDAVGGAGVGQAQPAVAMGEGDLFGQRAVNTGQAQEGKHSVHRLALCLLNIVSHMLPWAASRQVLPLAVEGFHGAEANDLVRLAVWPAAPPSAGRCGRRRHPRGPIGRQGYRSGSLPQGGPQGRAAVQGGQLQRRRRLHPLSRPYTWLAEHVGLGGRRGL